MAVHWIREVTEAEGRRDFKHVSYGDQPRRYYIVRADAQDGDSDALTAAMQAAGDYPPGSSEKAKRVKFICVARPAYPGTWAVQASYHDDLGDADAESA